MTMLEVVGASPRLPDADWLRLARRAKLLAWASLGWLCVEGSVAVIAGLAAGSTALVGFGFDSAIEGLASFIVVWRFTGSRVLSHTAERRAQRLVAVSFFLLAPYVAAAALHSLLVDHHPETTWVGTGLAAGSLLVCPWLGLAKRRIGAQLNSAATRGEGMQNLLCAYLAIGVLTGLLANSLLGVWWIDPGVALVIAAVCIPAGRKAWRGEAGCDGCC
jgi:divalent metal cation (Fe/Co/Zn/Cd) transporter